MPPLTLENASAIVPGGATARDVEKEKKLMQAQAKSAPPVNVQFTVERAFYYQGKVCEVGKSYTLPRLLALEMAAARKGRIVAEVEAAPAPAAAAAEKAAEAKKGERIHAR